MASCASSDFALRSLHFLFEMEKVHRVRSKMPLSQRKKSSYLVFKFLQSTLSWITASPQIVLNKYLRDFTIMICIVLNPVCRTDTGNKNKVQDKYLLNQNSEQKVDVAVKLTYNAGSGRHGGNRA